MPSDTWTRSATTWTRVTTTCTSTRSAQTRRGSSGSSSARWVRSSGSRRSHAWPRGGTKAPASARLHHRFDLPGERDVLVRDPALAPRVDAHADPVVVVLQVGMMVGGFGLLRHPVDERDGLHERGELVVLQDLAAPEAPPGEVTLDRPENLLVRKGGHLGAGAYPASSAVVASAFSSTSRPSANRPSSMDRGGRSLMTLS